MNSSVPYARAGRRRNETSLFVPVVLLALAAVVLLVTLPLTGVHVPGTRTLQAVLDRIPQPWKPPRPVSVPPPDVAPAAPPLIAQVSAAAPPAAPATSATSSASAAPAAPVIPIAAAAPLPAAPALGATPAQPEPVTAAKAPAVPSLPPAPPAARMDGFRHQWQTWNNCGPATITMALSHFGRTETQAQAAPVLKPNPNDKNVSPNELVAYVRSLGFQADWRVAGTLDTLKQLVANDIPVVVETWYTPHPNDGMGHYRLLVGYDDAAGRFTAYDSYEPPGLNLALPYGPFDDEWRVFDRTYVPVYPPEKADVVAAILGADRDDQSMWEHALAVSTDEAGAMPNDAFAWFDVGTNLVALGRTGEAVQAFDRARSLKLPWRMLWYQFAPFEAYMAEGRLNDVLALTAANLQQANDLEESQYFRGRALQALGQVAAARAAYQAAIRANPRYAPASYALSTLG